MSRLLFRFYDVLGGAVKINGVDVRSVSQKSLRSAIGVVPQAASMFNETMRYNLKYGKPDATQDELEQAARDSQLLDFIESLEDGWETLVGDRGLKVLLTSVVIPCISLVKSNFISPFSRPSFPGVSASAQPSHGASSRTPRLSCSTKRPAL